MTEPASTFQVVKAWLQQVVGLSTVSATLPEVATWFGTGWVTLPGVVGGGPNVYIPERQPVVQVDCYAANRAAAGSSAVSRKVPHGQAEALANRIVNATYPTPVPAVTLPAGFTPVWIEFVNPVSEVRELPVVDANYARFSVDLQINWIERTPVI